LVENRYMRRGARQLGVKGNNSGGGLDSPSLNSERGTGGEVGFGTIRQFPGAPCVLPFTILTFAFAERPEIVSPVAFRRAVVLLDRGNCCVFAVVPFDDLS
jgi:hypothetical protein